jgi:hypothetical protein
MEVFGFRYGAVRIGGDAGAAEVVRMDEADRDRSRAAAASLKCSLRTVGEIAPQSGVPELCILTPSYG